MTPKRENTQTVKVYGQDHSPWTQAVMLGLAERNTDFEMTTAPPLPVLLKWGIVMPAMRVGKQPWVNEAQAILASLGFSAASKEEIEAVKTAWTGVAHRTLPALRFFKMASLISDRSRSLLQRISNQFMRSFTVLYFFALLRFVKMAGVQKDPQNFGDQFLYWEEKLQRSGGQYLGGDAPDSLDFLLFGMVQCHCSIPVPPLTALLADPRLDGLRRWITRMQTRFSEFPYLYSRLYFEPSGPSSMSATFAEQTAFWLGFVFWLTLLPVTLLAIIVLALRVDRGH